MASHQPYFVFGENRLHELYPTIINFAGPILRCSGLADSNLAPASSSVRRAWFWTDKIIFSFSLHQAHFSPLKYISFLFAHLININAYHQPGVEAGKKAATNILKMKKAVCELLKKGAPSPLSVELIAEKTSLKNNEELIFKTLYRLAHNPSSSIHISSNKNPTEAEFYYQ